MQTHQEIVMARTTASKARADRSGRDPSAAPKLRRSAEGSASRKAQVLLSAEQYELLEAYAREQGKALSSLLRESLERTLLPMLERRRRQAALLRLTGQRLPVADWESIERELEERWERNEAV
jgi:hypothetical protein